MERSAWYFTADQEPPHGQPWPTMCNVGEHSQPRPALDKMVTHDKIKSSNKTMYIRIYSINTFNKSENYWRNQQHLIFLTK